MTLQDLPPNMGMDIDDLIISYGDNYDKIRGCTIASNKNPSRTVSMTLSEASVDYTTRIERLNNVSEEIAHKKLIDSLQLSYMDNKDIQVSRAADHENSAYPQRSSANALALKSTPTQYVDDNVINIQLLYDINAPTEPELWDGSFHPISLHGSLEHLVSDAKNIKDSLNFVAKYINNKQIDPKKSNDIQDFKGIGEVVWNLISLVYQLNWDSLIADKNSYTLRQKISAKFTLKVKLIPKDSYANKNKLALACIKRIPPPIPTKSQKEVNQISKYFQNIKLAPTCKLAPKSYVQASTICQDQRR